MLAAKKGRQEQLERLEKFLGGETVVFVTHQGKEFEATYDETVYERERCPFKVLFAQQAIFLDAAALADEECVLEFLKNGMDPNTCNADGLTALHQCCIENSLKLARLLVENGAEINAKDNDWWTPLHAAAACGHWRVVNFLLQNDADILAVNADGDIPIDIAEDEKTQKILQDEMDAQGWMKRKSKK